MDILEEVVFEGLERILFEDFMLMFLGFEDSFILVVGILLFFLLFKFFFELFCDEGRFIYFFYCIKD